MITTLRTRESQRIYEDWQKTGEKPDIWSSEAIFETNEYKIIQNRFPYDLVYSESLILLTKRTLPEAFFYATQWANDNGYDQVIYNLPKRQSIPDVVHVHIMKFKPNE